MTVQDVHIQSVLRPYKADNILNFSLRYVNMGGSSVAFTPITRAFLLNVLIVNNSGSTSNARICAAVRVNRIRLTTSNVASLEWLSAYGPTSGTVVNGTSTTAAGELVQRPPKNSLCQYWSMSGSNESETLFQLTSTSGDYVDVDYSIVLMDKENPVVVSTTFGGITNTLYRSYLDGPAIPAHYNPLFVASLN